MSIKFAIKSTQARAEKEGDLIVRFSGVAEPFNRVSEREGKKIGVDAQGNVKIKFNTGLDEKQVQFLPWYNEAEKVEVKKQIKELKPLIMDYYGGADSIEETNKFFWKDDRNVNRLRVNNSTETLFFDTKSAPHALLYLSIISGAFSDIVSPTKDWAERNGILHYMQLDTDDSYDENDDLLTRSDAHAALSDLRKEESSDALFILAWCIQYDTNAFGGINKSTPQRNLLNTHVEYIDGKLTMKRKKNTPKVFIEYAEKWKGQQTRPALFVEAYVKAGEYFNFVNQREKKYVTAEGTVLGNTIQEAVTTLMKPKFTQDLETLRDKVEAKWKE